jgi:hypothetical protein
MLKTHVPAKTNWRVQITFDFLEADSVANCSSSMAGQLVSAIDTVDFATAGPNNGLLGARVNPESFRQSRVSKKAYPFLFEASIVTTVRCS